MRSISLSLEICDTFKIQKLNWKSYVMENEEEMCLDSALFVGQQSDLNGDLTWVFQPEAVRTFPHYFGCCYYDLFLLFFCTLSTFKLCSEILHSWRWMLAVSDWAGPSGDVAGSLVARCSARSRQRHLDSSSRWQLAFANKLLAAAACLLTLCLQKRLGSVDPLC